MKLTRERKITICRTIIVVGCISSMSTWLMPTYPIVNWMTMDIIGVLLVSIGYCGLFYWVGKGT